MKTNEETEKEKARSKDIKADEPDLSVIRPPTAITSSTRNVAAHYLGDSSPMVAQMISLRYGLLTQSLPSTVIP